MPFGKRKGTQPQPGLDKKDTPNNQTSGKTTDNKTNEKVQNDVKQNDKKPSKDTQKSGKSNPEKQTKEKENREKQPEKKTSKTKTDENGNETDPNKTETNNSKTDKTKKVSTESKTPGSRRESEHDRTGNVDENQNGDYENDRYETDSRRYRRSREEEVDARSYRRSREEKVVDARSYRKSREEEVDTGRYRRSRVEDEHPPYRYESTGPMDAVKQATLINYHLAIEDSVDIDRIWEDMQFLFDDEEQEDIQTQGTKKAEMKKMLDILPRKDDRAFDTLVKALRPEYKWLSIRLQQGAQDEEKRVNRMGKGVRRKIALALLTARISERQKDGILDRVTEVVEAEMTHNSMRVSIPDHRASAQLNEEHREMLDLIRHEVDPLLYGEEPNSAREEDYELDDAMDKLRMKLEELHGIKESYAALQVSKNSVSTLPSQLLQKIEEVKTKLKLLRQEKQDLQTEADRLTEENETSQRSLTKTQERNRTLEQENRELDSELHWLEQSLRKQQDNKRDAERDFLRAEEENQKLKSELQQAHDKVSDLTLRNRSLDDYNSKLTRDNFKLTAANATLRKEARNRMGTNLGVAIVKTENQRLTIDRTQLRRDIQRLETERRQLVIKTQKLEAENQNLREQKRRLTADKKRTMDENKLLKSENKRLALGKYSPLPPIRERYPYRSFSYRRSRSRDNTPRSREEESLAGERSQSLERSLETPRSRKPVRRVARSMERAPARRVVPVRHTPRDSPWNKFREEKKNTLPKGRPGESKQLRTSQKEESGDEEGEGEGKKKPSYMKGTSASRKHHYLFEDKPAPRDSSPRRAAAWK